MKRNQPMCVRFKRAVILWLSTSTMTLYNLTQSEFTKQNRIKLLFRWSRKKSVYFIILFLSHSSPNVDVWQFTHSKSNMFQLFILSSSYEHMYVMLAVVFIWCTLIVRVILIIVDVAEYTHMYFNSFRSYLVMIVHMGKNCSKCFILILNELSN